ncbi:hypothetical protein [Kitasatospora sp. NPDC050543]|uniref:hypothetical protein n=1 Tax=Kitasatospora sp. NPDC050543 TaxID=3364054 RepID=UPI003792D3A5
MSGQTRVRLRCLLWELANVGEEIDPFAPDSHGAPLFAHIATLADLAAGYARDLEIDAHNWAAENGDLA